MGFVTLVLRRFDLASLCCLFVWGFTFLVPSLPSILAFLPVPGLFTSSGVFSVCSLCLLIRASIWAFSNASLLASFSFISFSVCNLLAFSSASLLASFSLNCLSVSVAIFLSCNTSFKSHFIAYLGISSLTILSISISSLSGTFCLCFLSPVFGFIYVVPPQSWGDQGDTKHSKCLLLGGRRLNQNDFNPQTERKWRRTGWDGPSRPSK